MGYRSDVVIAVSKKVYLESVLKQDLPEIFSNDWAQQTTTDDAFYWRFSDIKWYDSFDEIRKVEEWLNEIEQIQRKAVHSVNSYSVDQFGFLRIGEEYEDVEIKGDLHEFDIQYTRLIEYPGNIE